MQLSDYLKLRRMTATQFAEMIGVSVATVSRIANGINRPDWDTLDKIEAATDHAVSMADFRNTPRRGSAGRPLAVTSAAGRKAALTRKRRKAATAEAGA